MFLSLTQDHVQFCYGSIRWQYSLDEITELGLLKKKKIYLFENGSFIIVTAIAYYCMLFTRIIELYYIIPSLLCYAVLVIMRFYNTSEFDYYVIVKDIHKNQTKVKINASDRVIIGKEIDKYLDYEFDRILEKTKNITSK